MKAIMLTGIKEILLKQYGVLFLWIPILLSIGIGIYFLEIVDIEFIIITSISILFIFLYSLYNNPWNIIRSFTYILGVVILGYTTIFLHTIYSKAPIIEDNLGVIWIRAKLEKIEARNKGHRLILSNLDFWQPEKKKFPKNETPEYIRIEVKTPIEEIKPGHFVSLKAVLKPPPQKPVYPKGYDFSKYAYYSKIGAVGYSISPVKVFTYKNKSINWSIKTFIHEVRYNLIKTIKSNLSKTELSDDSKQIILALIFGERGAIDKDTVKNMRIAGIGHILAISGLHMALIMAGCYYFIRLFFSLFTTIILRYDIKKYSAIISLLIGFFYLSITSFPISAIRAYIMASIFLISIIADRNTNPIRPLSIAAAIILLIDPYALTTPSFQMSFSAVLGLITFFSYFPMRSNKSHNNKNFSILDNLKILLKYFFAIIMSSIVAGLATAPFAIYHFGQVSTYGIISNMVAIPLTTFVIMPFSILSLIFSNFDFSTNFLSIAGKAIDIMVTNANYVSSLPYPIRSFVKIPTFYIVGFSISAVWLIIWRKPLNYIGIIPLILFIILIMIPIQKPDLIISSEGKLFAVNYKNKIAFSSYQKERYARLQWRKYNGNPKMVRIKDMIKKESDIFQKYNDDVLVKINNKKILFIMNDDSMVKCSDIDYIINMKSNSIICHDKTIVSLKRLNDKGTHAIWIGNVIKILNDKEKIYMNL